MRGQSLQRVFTHGDMRLTLTSKLWFTTGVPLGPDKILELNLGSKNTYYHVFSCFARRPAESRLAFLKEQQQSRLQPGTAAVERQHGTGQCECGEHGSIALLRSPAPAPCPPQPWDCSIYLHLQVTSADPSLPVPALQAPGSGPGAAHVTHGDTNTDPGESSRVVPEPAVPQPQASPAPPPQQPLAPPRVLVNRDTAS